MNESAPNLGVSFFSDRLYYAINDPSGDAVLSEIGSFNFNFNIASAIRTQHPDQYPHIQNTIEGLVKEYSIGSVHALTIPSDECWTALPKVVYDNADEREDHLAIIMKGVSREEIEPTWHSVSKNQRKFLCIRRASIMEGYAHLSKKVGLTEFSSDFEIAAQWSAFHKPGGSFLMIGCHKNVVSVTSFMLGRFRAATYIKYDQAEDLPYHWLQQSAHSTWLKGLHEHTYLFGKNCHVIQKMLSHFWDKSSELSTLNTLDQMGVMAEETTYGFDLAEAFPAILLSLDQ